MRSTWPVPSRPQPRWNQQYGAYCAAVARNILGDDRDVEECLSDCWLQVWNAIPPAPAHSFQGVAGRGGAQPGPGHPAAGWPEGRTPWTRRALELASALPQGDAAQDRVEARELGEAISCFLWTQKPEARIAFLRRYWYADSLEAVARRMGWSLSKTKSVLFRTRNRLRDFLKQEGLWNG